ncbi:MAG: hypothetical protein F6K56_41165 [Moorea sp. SIO3G5]|nr:hypothetical protein [Moorena sp. SIO3G5]
MPTLPDQRLAVGHATRSHYYKSAIALLTLSPSAIALSGVGWANHQP